MKDRLASGSGGAEAPLAGVVHNVVPFVFALSLFAWPVAGLPWTCLLIAMTSRRLKRLDGQMARTWLVFGLGVLLYVMPTWVTQGSGRSSFEALLQAGLAFAVVSFMVWTRPARPLTASSALWGGAVFGALAMVTLSAIDLWQGAPRAYGWTPHPNVWAALATGAALGGALLFPRGRWPWLKLSLACAGLSVVAMAGSRTALLAALIGFALLGWQELSSSAARPRRARAWVILLTIGLLFAASTTLTPLGSRWFAWNAAPSTNLILASEDMAGAFWTRRDVLPMRGADIGGHATYHLSATVADPLARLHQRVLLRPDEVMTLSVEFGPGAEAAGVHAFSEAGGRISLSRSGEVEQLREPPTLLRTAVAELEDGWTRLELTVMQQGEDPLVWRFGLAPSLRGGLGSEVWVRRPQLSSGPEALPYTPTSPEDRGRDLAGLSAAQRWGYVAAALAVMRGHWWLGHGPSADFSSLVEARSPGLLAASDRPSHPHNLPMAMLVQYGLLGLAGLSLMILAAAWLVPAGQRWALAPLWLAMLVMSLGDATFFSAGTGYIGLALIAWRRRSPAPEGAATEVVPVGSPVDHW